MSMKNYGLGILGSPV